MPDPNHIKYKDGYKYQLAENYDYHTAIYWTVQTQNGPVGNDWVKIYPNGLVSISKGYAWDGPSGPTIDTKGFMRASLVHDALYQLMREGFLDEKWKDEADNTLKRICKEDGMSDFRAWYVHLAVQKFGGMTLKKQKDVITAP